VADGPGLVLDRDLKPDNVAMLELGLVASVCARGLKDLGERVDQRLDCAATR
jgi:hypothetical protein